MVNRFTHALSLVSVFILSACTSVGLGVANIPAMISGGETFKDIAYSAESAQKLDIYVPRKQTNEAAAHDVIIFFYGGRWTDGQKDQYAFVAQRFTQEGYIVVIPDYRKYPTVKFPAFVEDGANAVKWVHQHIENYGGSPQRMFLAGHSAGAHIAALLAADRRYFDDEQAVYDDIKAFAGLAGPYAFTPEADDLKDMFGPPSQYPAMQVPTHIDGSEPPMLLLHGTDDDKVGTFNLERLKNALEDKDVSVSTTLYEGAGHIDMVAHMIWYWPYQRPIAADIIHFFRRIE